jgi:hypothetical protein
MTIEGYQEAPLISVMEAFETWLFYHGKVDCEMTVKRPGLRPETRELLAREKRQTPMDKEWQDFADKNGATVSGTLFGRRIDMAPRASDVPVSSDREP